MNAAVGALLAIVLSVAVPLQLRWLEAGSGVISRLLFPAVWLAAISLAFGPGAVTGSLSLPWLGLTGVAAVTAVRTVARRRDDGTSGPALTIAIADAFLAFGAANLSANRLGLQPLGFDPTVVLLTAVHFHTAGFVLLLSGLAAWLRRPSRWLAVALALLVLGTVVTAAGYVGLPGAMVAGAFLVAAGGLGIAAGTILAARHLRGRWSSRLAVIAAAGLFVSMPLAMIWAAGQSFGSLPFDLAVMIRTHGVLNALAVAVPISLAWSLDANPWRGMGGPAPAPHAEPTARGSS